MKMQREDGAGEAERHRRHDDDGADEALELRGQHQQDDDDGEAEDRQHRAVAFAERRGFGQRDERGCRPAAAALRSRSARASASPSAKSGARPEVIETERMLLLARQRRRHGALGQRGDGRHRHEAAVGRLQEDVLEVGRIVDRIGGRDQLHRVAAVFDEDVADLAAVEHRLQRLGEAGDVDAEVGGALAVDRRRKAAAASRRWSSRGCWKRGSFSISATILLAASPSSA